MLLVGGFRLKMQYEQGLGQPVADQSRHAYRLPDDVATIHVTETGSIAKAVCAGDSPTLYEQPGSVGPLSTAAWGAA
jgi:hypothetical protein